MTRYTRSSALAAGSPSSDVSSSVVQTPAKPKKRKRTPTATPESVANDTNLQTNSVASTPDNPLAASFYGVNPFAGRLATITEEEEGEEGESRSRSDAVPSATAPAGSVTQSAQQLPITSFEVAMDALTNVCATLKDPVLDEIRLYLTTNEYFRGAALHAELWNYDNFLTYIVDRKLENLNKCINKVRRHKVPVKLGDTIVWDAGAQIFSVCVPCFRAGRPPQQCIFHLKCGFTSHRKRNVGNVASTAYDKCLIAAEYLGTRTGSTHEGEVYEVKRANLKEGYTADDYRLFRLPALDDRFCEIEFTAVEKGTKISALMWEVEAGLENSLQETHSVTFVQFMRELISGKFSEYIVSAAEEANVALLESTDATD